MQVLTSKALIGSLLIASLAACAGTPSPHPATASLAEAKSAPPGCVAATGRHSSPKQVVCAGFGRSWTQDDLRRTGEMDPAQALRSLDPSVQVGSH